MAAAEGPANATEAGTAANTRANGAADEKKLPLLEDIMQLSRIGDVEAVRALLKTGKFTASYKDNEGITPLHWAAINNQLAMCKFLLESGAEVDAKGGEAVATPAMWAAQRANYYVVNLLLQAGADPQLTDAQGYNVLHLATFDGNIFLLTLLLHQDMPVDTPDLQGHTCLMWAAYKGFPTVVDLFLRWGASVSAVDEQGFTALHWALVKGSQACIQKLVEYGSDRFAETNNGKTPHVVAREMKSQRMWTRALGDCGFDAHANTKVFPVSFLSFLMKPTNLSRLYFLMPTFIIYVCIWLLSSFAIYLAVPLMLFFAYAAQWVATRMLEWAPINMHHIHKTPYMAGVFAATCFWVGVRWLFVLLPYTWGTSLFMNLVFGVIYSLCAYFYYLCISSDPGYIPKLNSRNQQKKVIEELLSLFKFDDQSFCIQCMIRTPVRSKHCKRCGRCVAKHDHHCPWVHNCVASNNLRHFYLYILCLEVGIILFIRLVLLYLFQAPAPENTECRVLSAELCSIILRDPFTVVLSIWAALQLTWVTMLLFVQSVQISRAVTTYESMKGHHLRGGASEVVTAAVTAGSTSLEGAQLPQPGAASGASHAHAHKGGWFTQWKKLLGLDTFVATAQSTTSGDAARRRGNPYSRGVATNCRDFWCDPAPVFKTREAGQAFLDGEVVNYARMYEPPPRMKFRREGRYEALSAQEES